MVSVPTFSSDFCFISKDFSLAPFHTAFNSLFPQNYVSLYPPPSRHTHIVYLNLKDSPSVMQAVSPLHILTPSLFPLSSALPSPECLDRSKWCDCDCSVGRLPLSVFGKSDASRGREEREKAEQRDREKGGKVLLNNKAWLPSREPRLAFRSQTPLKLVRYSLPLCLHSLA